MKKIIIIPADSINSGISRSHYFCDKLSKTNIVYKLAWLDPQSSDFNDVKFHKLYSLYCFLGSLFRLPKKVKVRENLYTIYLPRISLLVLPRLIGTIPSLKIARKFNSIVLSLFCKKTNPDCVFYADGFDLYPVVPGKHINISDIQDDFDNNNFRDNDYQKKYGRINFNKTLKNYVVSPAAAKKLNRYYKAEFEFLPNGAEFNEMRNLDPDRLNKFRSKYFKEGKINVTYIGGRAWYDEVFASKFVQLIEANKWPIHLIVVGNHKPIQSPYATFTGAVSNHDSYYFYKLSDVGVMLKDSKNSDFLINSLPLKIVQYSALKVAFISPNLTWFDSVDFDNVQVLASYDPINLLDNIKKIDINSNFEGSSFEYDWNSIVARIDSVINQ